jgi:L-type amino acid transporter 9
MINNDLSFFKGLIAIAFCMPSNVDGLIDFFSFAAWIFYGLTFAATLCCKFTMKNAERVISVSDRLF